ncbi:amino acid ABC transporter permease [Candidatus Liberibacter asiaticus]|uniref:Amino acid ABC transporter (Permease) n=2 Tax=Liberibacter asiaticus TaxID=34021 RepID=C6XGT3_LIBAP|nr:ABC transporter permease subunit [Candidatus Liberibacter asiaticus]ACT57586.1 amino acid ABC transporter (permease) [Candidatus Liberibacter asiaticus str. psy62]AGH17349.1 amino acid ABC transporter permease [Candidatus Liberibacter asiaticus str. gxpsy]ALK07631.1 ABC transporter permease subunit [Candidatus Liberibacter asiaticus]ASK53123.1 cysteine ABC transporter permease [Candidatus Liberibacter asiaticus]AWL14448.1 amino acid ABC transporter permease [Candidatus Liberibacter asiaticu
MKYEWFNLIIDSFPQLLYAAIVVTLPIACISFVISLIIGFFIAVIRIFFSDTIISLIMHFYVWIFRGTPLLVQLFVIFYGLPHIGIVFDSFVAIIISLTLNFSAYISEIIRSSIISIPKGQWDASYAIGLTRKQTIRHIILPQTITTSAVPLSSEFISILKSTSVASTITIPEIFQTAQRIVSTTYQPLIIYCELAFVYLILTSFCYIIQIKIESSVTQHTYSVDK